MYCRILAATALLASSALMATAQENAPPPPPESGAQAQGGDQAAPPPPGPKPDEHRGWRHGKHDGPPGMRHGPRRWGHEGPGMRGKGFELSLGWGRELQVNCGDEPIKACIDASAPLIDSLSSAPMPGRGHGMRHNRGVDMGPGGPGGPGGEPGTPPEPPMPDDSEQE